MSKAITVFETNTSLFANRHKGLMKLIGADLNIKYIPLPDMVFDNGEPDVSLQDVVKRISVPTRHLRNQLLRVVHIYKGQEQSVLIDAVKLVNLHRYGVFNRMGHWFIEGIDATVNHAESLLSLEPTANSNVIVLIYNRTTGKQDLCFATMPWYTSAGIIAREAKSLFTINPRDTVSVRTIMNFRIRQKSNKQYNLVDNGGTTYFHIVPEYNPRTEMTQYSAELSSMALGIFGPNSDEIRKIKTDFEYRLEECFEKLNQPERALVTSVRSLRQLTIK